MNETYLTLVTPGSTITPKFEASSFLDTETPFIIVNTATNIAYKNFEDMAKHQNRIKNRLVDDRAFLINFEATRYDYEFFKLI